MSLFLKSLPKSFFRTVVSSRPIFNKATSLFPSIASNAYHTPRLPTVPLSRTHNRTVCLGNSNEDKRKIFLSKYGLHVSRSYSKKVTRAPKKPSKNATQISSGPVTCTVNKGIVECSVNCGQGREDDEKSTTQKCQSKFNMKSKKKVVPKYTKNGIESQRCDVKALTGTWVSNKPIKFDFSCKNVNKRKSENITLIKLEDEKSLTPCKISSKQHLQKSSQERKVKTEKKPSQKVCKQEPISEAKLREVRTTNKSDTKSVCTKEKIDTPCQKSTQSVQADQSAINSCIESCKIKTNKTPSMKNVLKSKTKTKVCGTEKDKQKVKKCKPCSVKKTAPKKVTKKSYTPPKRKRSKKQKLATKNKCIKEELAKAVNSSLVVTTYTKMTDSQSNDIVEKLKKELEQCKSKGAQLGGPCMEPPKLDAALPGPKEQEKDIISGSKTFLKNVCDGIFKNKPPSKTPLKSRSTPEVRSSKKQTLKKSKSTDCKIDLNPKYCEKPEKDQKKNEKKASTKSSTSSCNMRNEEKKKSKPKIPCSFEAPKRSKDDKTQVCGRPKTPKEEKKSLCDKNKEANAEKSIEYKIQVCKRPEDAGKKSETSLCRKIATKEDKKAVCGDLKNDGVRKVCSGKTGETRKDSSKKIIDPCKANDDEKSKVKVINECKKDTATGPPDQSPIMQCIAFCKKKKQADTPQKGKGVPPRDKKPCCSDPKIYKKIASLNESTKESCEKDEEIEKEVEKKDRINEFVPCKFEEIKPGIRKHEMQEEKCAKKENTGVKCDDENVVKADPSCRKFKYSCPEKCKKEKEEKSEETTDSCN